MLNTATPAPGVNPSAYQPQPLRLLQMLDLLMWALETELRAEVAFQGRPVVRQPGSQDFQIISREGRNVMACVHGHGNIHQKDSCHEITASLSR